MKFAGKVGNGPVNKWLNFDGDPDHRLDAGIVFRILTIGRYGKWLTDINLLLILIHQMAALVRRALAEVCTVPVLFSLILSTTVSRLNSASKTFGSWLPQTMWKNLQGVSPVSLTR